MWFNLFAHRLFCSKNQEFGYNYNYLAITEYCVEVLGFTMVSKEGLRKIIARIAKENSCEL